MAGFQYDPHPKQISVHENPKRFKVLNWGRQTGKSILALHYIYYEALRKQGRYWLVLPTYKQAKNVFWKQYIQMIPEELQVKKDSVDLSVVFPNNLKITLPDGTLVEHDPKLPPSMIELKGSDDADLLRGAKVNGFVFDEYAFHKPDAWETVFRPMLSTTKGWAMFISSPNGYNHFYDLCMDAKKREDYFYSHATPYDNPAIEPEELEKTKKDVSPLKWAQEYMAEFKQMEGLVYDDFNTETHVIDPDDIPREGTDIVAIDFGFQNPTAILFIRIDYDQNWYIYDEVYKSKLTTKDMVQIIKEKTAGKYISHYVGDSAQAEHIANLQREGIPIQAVSKFPDSIQKGIELVAQSMKPREQMDGPPKPKMFISANCKNVAFEFGNYRYPEGKSDRNPNEKPIKQHDHAMDALRYAKLFMTYEVQKDVRIEETNLTDSDGFF